MVEELKIIADILKGVSESAVHGIIAYLIFAYAKPVTIVSIVGVVVVKVAGLFKPLSLEVHDVKGVRIEES